MISKPSSARGELTVDVAIVGAGPAGLTAGYLLCKAGLRVAIVEKDPAYVGGIGRTVEHRGYRIDIGAPRLNSKNQAVVELWQEILPEGFVQRPRVSRIYFERKIYTYPLRPFEVLRKFGLWRSGLCLASCVRTRLFPIREVQTFEDWVSNQFGRRFYSCIMKSYAEKVWGLPGNEISADWAAQRIVGLSLRSAAIDRLKRILWSNRRTNAGPEVEFRQETFRYSRPGPGGVWETARSRIEEAGGQVLTGHGLKQLASDGQGGWRMIATGAEGQLVVNAAHAISSAPMRELAARLYPLPQSTIAASQLRYRAVLTVALMIRSDNLFPGNRFYIHDDRVQVGRVQNYGPWLPETASDESVAGVGLEYFCFEGDELWSMDDAELVELAKREMDVLGLVPPNEVMGGVVVRQEKAYPLYDERHAAHVAAIREELEEKHPTLHLVGRNGMHRDGSQDHAVVTAMLTVENILAGERIHDIWGVVADAGYHEASEGAGRTWMPASAPEADLAAGPGPVRNEAQRAAASSRKAA